MEYSYSGINLFEDTEITSAEKFAMVLVCLWLLENSDQFGRNLQFFLATQFADGEAKVSSQTKRDLLLAQSDFEEALINISEEVIDSLEKLNISTYK